MELKFYDKNGVLRFTCSPDDSSSCTNGIMSENVLNLSFTLPAFYSLNVGDYVFFLSVKYVLDQNYVPKKISTVEWKYDIGLYAPETLIKDTLVLNTDFEPSYTLTAAAREHVKLVVDNINRRFGSTDWKVGEVIVSDNITIDYNGSYCTKALAQIAEAANTEYWIDGTTVNLCRCEYGAAVELGYMNGLLNLEKTTADNTKFFTRLFPIGTTRNIDRDKYGYSRLQLPGREKYREQNTEFGVIEFFEETAFTGIYPRRTGVVGSVRSIEKPGEDGSPFTIYYFTDPTIPFDPNDYEIGGLVKNVTFVTGELSGRDFEVNYDSVKKEFEVITQFPYDDMQLPGGLLIPKAGDKYNLFNISMPDEYYALAETEYSEAVDKYMLDNKYDKAVYKASTDYIDITSRNITLSVGMRVRLTDASYFPSGYRDSRISKITRKVNNPNAADIEISDLLNKGKITTIENGIDQVTSYAKEAMAGLPEVVKSWEGTAASDSNIYSGKKTEKELLKRLSKDADDVATGRIRFEKGIQIGTDVVPGLLGGSIDKDANAELKSLTLREFLEVPELRANRTTVIAGEQWCAPGLGIVESVDTTSRVIVLKIEDGTLPELEFDDLCKGIFNTGTGFATSFFRIIQVRQNGDKWQASYLLKPGTTLHPQPFMHFVAYGNFSNTERQASAVQTREYLRFMVGVNTWDISASMIHAHIGNMRGMTINGVDFSGYSGLLRNFYFDGTLAQLAPAIADSEQNTKDYIDEKTAAENLELRNFIDNTYTQEMLAMQAQLDGQVESFFFQQDPTLTNAPANGWTTTALKDSHLNDTYTNLTTGKSWRWSKSGSTYSWVPIADTATEKALLIAGQAKDTADGKRRTFMVTPYPPYDAGDLWTATDGELMKCIYARATGSYVASDWVKATKYTDDSAVENMVVGGRNLLTKSKGLNIGSVPAGVSASIENGMIKVVSTQGNNNAMWIRLDGALLIENLKVDDDIVVSYWAYSPNSTDKPRVYPNGGIGYLDMNGVMSPNMSQMYAVTKYKGGNLDLHFGFLYAIGTFYIAAIKIEKGNKPTDWSPAPEDIESGIEEAKNTGAAYNTMGEYSATTNYTGTKYQRDVVWVANSAMATGREYFVAKINAGSFAGVAPSDTSKWERIGAQFSSVATDFLLSRKIRSEEIDVDSISVKKVVATNGTNKVLGINENGNGSIQRYVNNKLVFEIASDDNEVKLIYYDSAGSIKWYVGSNGTIEKQTVDSWLDAFYYKYTSVKDIQNTASLSATRFRRFASGSVSGNQNYNGLTALSSIAANESPASVLSSGRYIPDGTYCAGGVPMLTDNPDTPIGWTEYQRLTYTFSGGYKVSEGVVNYLIKDLIDM